MPWRMGYKRHFSGKGDAEEVKASKAIQEKEVQAQERVKYDDWAILRRYGYERLNTLEA